MAPSSVKIWKEGSWQLVPQGGKPFFLIGIILRKIQQGYPWSSSSALLGRKTISMGAYVCM